MNDLNTMQDDRYDGYDELLALIDQDDGCPNCGHNEE